MANGCLMQLAPRRKHAGATRKKNCSNYCGRNSFADRDKGFTHADVSIGRVTIAIDGGRAMGILGAGGDKWE